MLKKTGILMPAGRIGCKKEKLAGSSVAERRLKVH